MIIEAILKIDPNANVSVKSDNINEIKWHDGNPNNITKSDIEAKMVEAQAEYDANQYQRDRSISYPPIGDQLDMLWHSIDQDPVLKTKYFHFYEAIKAIKVKYPKND